MPAKQRSNPEDLNWPRTTMEGQTGTLPPLQKSFVNIYFVFAWEFCIEKWQGFLVNFFLVFVSHETKHENSSKIRDENSEQNFHGLPRKLLEHRRVSRTSQVPSLSDRRPEKGVISKGSIHWRNL